MGSRNAKRIRENGMEQIMIDLKPARCDSFVYSQKFFDITKLSEYVDKKSKEDASITLFRAYVTAIGMVIYNRNKINRFVQNRHIYEHNDIVVSFVAKTSFEDGAEEIMIMVPIKENDNINTIGNFIENKLDSIRNKKVAKEGANDAIDILGKLPNIIRIPIVGLLKWCDKKGILPASLTKDNLYYSSVIVSNLGTFNSNSIHHNITNFGTCSSLATMGTIKEEETIEDGKKVTKKICDWGIAFDERVADGFYLIKTLEMLQYIFNHPELLEQPANTKIDI